MVNRRDDRNGGAQRSRGESQRQRRQDVSHDERYGTYHSSQSLMGWDSSSGDVRHHDRAGRQPERTSRADRGTVSSRSQGASRQSSGRPSSDRQAPTRQNSGRSGAARPSRDRSAAQRSIDRHMAEHASAGRQQTRQQSADRHAARRQVADRQSASHTSAGRRSGASQVAHSQDPRHRGTRPQAGNRRPANRAPAQKKRGGGKLKYVLVAVLALVLVGAGAAFAYYQNIEGNLHAGLDQKDLEKYLVETDLTNEPFYMLLMGTDGSSEREEDESFGGSFRTDSIILARIDPVNKKVSMVSIHRDTMVDMGEYGQQKVNAAHAFGGAALSVKTVSDFAGVDISHYAEINFDGFRDIVDALGGVEVDVPVEINDEDAGGHLDAGLQTLNGEQALILCRSRNTYADSADPDSMRAANQRLVLSAIAEKILSSDVATIANSVTAISKYVTTDLDVSDIIGLAQAMRGMDTSTDFYTAMDPVTNKLIGDGWYTYSNEEEWKAMMKRMDEGLPPSEDAVVDEKTGTVIATNGQDPADSEKLATISVKNGTTKSARTQEAVNLLKNAGFTNASGSDANSTDHKKTLVIYKSASHEREANQIVEALGQGTAQLDNGEYLFESNFLVLIGSDWKDAS